MIRIKQNNGITKMPVFKMQKNADRQTAANSGPARSVKKIRSSSKRIRASIPVQQAAPTTRATGKPQGRKVKRA